jgi:hypothetical protein
MPKSADEVTFDPRPINVGVEWCIVATYPSGKKEHIAGFRSDEDAREWFAGRGRQAWLKAGGYVK